MVSILAQRRLIKGNPNCSIIRKQEKDLATGVTYWMQCLNHIQESPVNANIKELFGKLKFYNYTEDEDENTIVLRHHKMS